MARPPTPPRDYTELIKKLSEQSIKPRPTTDTELINRINEYYDFCHEHEFQINYQSLVAYCGLTMQEARDIADGQNNDIVGGGASRIMRTAGEICTAIDSLRIGDGTHKNANFAMFEKKQPNPGGGYMDTPPIAIVTPDLLAAPSKDRKALLEKYKDYLPEGKRIIDVEAEEVQDKKDE